MDQSGKKNSETWNAIESEYAKTAAERSVDNVLSRDTPRKIQSVQHGVKLDDDEVANII